LLLPAHPMWAFTTKVLWKSKRYGKVEICGISWNSLAEWAQKGIKKTSNIFDV